MELSPKTLGITGGVVLLLFIVLAGVMTIKKNSYESRITELQNAVAQRDVTIETQKGVFQKLTLQSKDLSSLLDSKDEQIQLLQKELKKGKEELLTANSLVVRWKKAYEAQVAGHQTEVPPVVPGGIVRKKVEFEKDFGYIGVSGFTLTDPPEATLKVQQNRPLKLSVAVSQDKDGTWKSRATSSEENMAIDITLAAVNPWLLEPRWYENIGLSVDLGGGTGFLAGVGASYKIGKFEVGPKGWFTIGGGGVGGFVGAQLLWHPFAR